MTRIAIDKVGVHDAIAALRAELALLGKVELRFSNDVFALQEAHRSLDKGTGENFRAALDTLPPNRFFWLGAYLDGRVIGTVAARLDEISWPLQLFVKNYWERAFVAADGGPVRLADGSPKAARDYTGRIAYLGEAVTDPALRNNNLSYVLVRMALLFCYDEWRPSVAYGWMRDWHAFRGLPIRWGFNRCEAGAFDWLRPPAEEDWHNLAFLACDHDGFQTLLKHPAPPALFRQQRNSPEESAPRTEPSPAE